MSTASVARWVSEEKTPRCGDFASLNLYAYCGNNPVARSDDGGEAWHVVIGAVIGGVIGLASSLFLN
jgi:hypothetical protein